MKVRLEQGPEGSPNFCFGLYDEAGECIEFVQSDWDYAGLASRFGWTPCDCEATDGTVKCPHRTVSEMLADSFDFLSARDGDEFEIED